MHGIRCSALDLIHCCYDEHWFISNPTTSLANVSVVTKQNPTEAEELVFYQKPLKLYSSPCGFESPILPKADSIADVKSSDSLSVKKNCNQLCFFKI